MNSKNKNNTTYVNIIFFSSNLFLCILSLSSHSPNSMLLLKLLVLFHGINKSLFFSF